MSLPDRSDSPCPVCNDDGWVEQWTHDDHVLTMDCPRLGDPDHAPFNASGLLGDPVSRTHHGTED